MATRTIKMDNATTRFYQGVASASRVRDEHVDVAFPSTQAEVALFWFYVGSLAAGEHGCESSEDFTSFILGANTRVPQPEHDNEED